MSEPFEGVLGILAPSRKMFLQSLKKVFKNVFLNFDSRYVCPNSN